MDGWTDGPMDRPSYRDAFLTDASKKRKKIREENPKERKMVRMNRRKDDRKK